MEEQAENFCDETVPMPTLLALMAVEDSETFGVREEAVSVRQQGAEAGKQRASATELACSRARRENQFNQQTSPHTPPSALKLSRT